MKTFSKFKIALVIIVGGLIFSCKDNNRESQENLNNGSETTIDTATNQQHDYNMHEQQNAAPDSSSHNPASVNRNPNGTQNNNTGVDTTSTNRR